MLRMRLFVPALLVAVVGAAVLAGTAAAKPKKLSFHEQREWEGIEAAITVAEEAVTAREAEVTAASTGNHVALAAACKALEEAHAAVEKLYARWQELEAKRSGTA